jgi:plastocyanin
MHKQAYSRWLAAAAALIAVAACGGGGEKTGAGASTGATTGAAPAPAPSAGAGATTAAAPGGAAAAKPITGKTWDVKMIGDATGYRYDPKDITIKQGDGIKWTVVSTAPHDVSFWADSLPPGTAGALQANMTNTLSPLVGPLLMNVGDTYTMSFAGVPPGTYKYYCTPHLALGMRGTITVQ